VAANVSVSTIVTWKKLDSPVGMEKLMIVHASLRAVIRAAFSAAIFIASPAIAIDDTTRVLARNQHAVEQLTNLGDQLKAVLTPEIGFPDAALEHWYAAVDAAFSPDLLEADVLKELEAQLDDETRDAALAFDASPLGQHARELIAASLGNTDDKEIKRLSTGRNYLETASTEQNGLFVDLFETQLGPRRAGAAMDAYFRAMKTAAEPVIGAPAADQWIAGATHLRTGYIENYFLLMVSTFSQLPEDRLQELVNAVGTPKMVSYAEQSTTAFIEVLNAAVDRLVVDYVQRLAEDE
jgi:hypothetical protein